MIAVGEALTMHTSNPIGGVAIPMCSWIIRRATSAASSPDPTVSTTVAECDRFPSSSRELSSLITTMYTVVTPPSCDAASGGREIPPPSALGDGAGTSASIEDPADGRLPEHATAVETTDMLGAVVDGLRLWPAAIDTTGDSTADSSFGDVALVDLGTVGAGFDILIGASGFWVGEGEERSSSDVVLLTPLDCGFEGSAGSARMGSAGLEWLVFLRIDPQIDHDCEAAAGGDGSGVSGDDEEGLCFIGPFWIRGPVGIFVSLRAAESDDSELPSPYCAVLVALPSVDCLLSAVLLAGRFDRLQRIASSQAAYDVSVSEVSLSSMMMPVSLRQRTWNLVVFRLPGGRTSSMLSMSKKCFGVGEWGRENEYMPRWSSTNQRLFETMLPSCVSQPRFRAFGYAAFAPRWISQSAIWL